MTTYFINFADPLRNKLPVLNPIYAFAIPPGGFNGPGGSVASSNLRLYGRGALEWGEAVDEDLLRLAENFSGATPPPYAVAGQLWLRSKFYWMTGAQVYRNNPNATVTPFWDIITPSVAGFPGGTNTPPGAVVVGQTYWYTGAGPFAVTDAFGNPILPNTLYRWDLEFKQVPAGWLQRSHVAAVAPPVDGAYVGDPAGNWPEQDLLFWDQYAASPFGVTYGGQWVAPPTSIVSSVTPPAATTGAFWWNPVTQQLSIWDGSAWGGIILASGTVPMSGTLDMNSNYIVNLLDPVNPQDAATMNYVDNAVTIGNLAPVLNGTYLRLDATNDPLTGSLNVGGFSVTNLPVEIYPLPNANDAASITYVNGAIAAIGAPGGGGFSAVNAFANNTTVVAHKPGDIYVDTATPSVYVAITTSSTSPFADPAGWKQFWPAQYS